MICSSSLCTKIEPSKYRLRAITGLSQNVPNQRWSHLAAGERLVADSRRALEATRGERAGLLASSGEASSLVRTDLLTAVSVLLVLDERGRREHVHTVHLAHGLLRHLRHLWHATKAAHPSSRLLHHVRHLTTHGHRPKHLPLLLRHLLLHIGHLVMHLELRVHHLGHVGHLWHRHSHSSTEASCRLLARKRHAAGRT